MLMLQLERPGGCKEKWSITQHCSPDSLPGTNGPERNPLLSEESDCYSYKNCLSQGTCKHNLHRAKTDAVLSGECEWGGSLFRFPIWTVQFLAPMQFETFPLYIKLDQWQITRKCFSGWAIFIDQTVLTGRCENLQKKWTNSQFFEKYSFIASKSTFEFISTDVHVLHCITDSYGRSHRTAKIIYILWVQLCVPSNMPVRSSSSLCWARPT